MEPVCGGTRLSESWQFLPADPAMFCKKSEPEAHEAGGASSASWRCTPSVSEQAPVAAADGARGHRTVGGNRLVAAEGGNSRVECRAGALVNLERSSYHLGHALLERDDVVVEEGKPCCLMHRMHGRLPP